ncbi:MAG: AmmeMemoRadiSam system protein B [Chlorobi bacterium]|nr:AmmeMemoRadiSam system protein B [Chlorobiota bacterium]
MKLQIILLIVILSACSHKESKNDKTLSVRYFKDTIGFAHTATQTDSLMNRIERYQNNVLAQFEINNIFTKKIKACICPHDDYSYVGYLYPLTLKSIKANTIVLIGVAHKAKLLGLENIIVFDNYDFWNAPYGKIKVSDYRDSLIADLPQQIFVVNDSMQKMEHSLEAMLPFLQYYNRKIEILPILIPYMPYSKIDEISKKMAKSLSKIMINNNLDWGKDIAIVISNDAVHYGDEDWGGKNFARYGADSSGYKKAIAHEMEIINTCLTEKIIPEKIKKFTEYTVDKNDFKQYTWTWCGRYSVPFGLSTSYYLGQFLKSNNLTGYFIDYSTSIKNDTIPVSDLNMGLTAPANLRHWVGYVGLLYYE